TAAKDGAAAAAAPTMELKDGTLDWGFKESFRKYLASPFSATPYANSSGAEAHVHRDLFRDR
ncbi:HtaA domain-containing protein, partial [Streptomyces sp. BE308]